MLDIRFGSCAVARVGIIECSNFDNGLGRFFYDTGQLAAFTCDAINRLYEPATITKKVNIFIPLIPMGYS